MEKAGNEGRFEGRRNLPRTRISDSFLSFSGAKTRYLREPGGKFAIYGVYYMLQKIFWSNRNRA